MPAHGGREPARGLTSAISASADEEPAFVLRGEGTHVFECKPLPTTRTGMRGPSARPTRRSTTRAARRAQRAENMFEAIGDRSTVSASIAARQDGGSEQPALAAPARAVHRRRGTLSRRDQRAAREHAGGSRPTGL
jgi:hypothetical protein